MSDMQGFELVELKLVNCPWRILLNLPSEVFGSFYLRSENQLRRSCVRPMIVQWPDTDLVPAHEDILQTLQVVELK